MLLYQPPERIFIMCKLSLCCSLVTAQSLFFIMLPFNFTIIILLLKCLMYINSLMVRSDWSNSSSMLLRCISILRISLSAYRNFSTLVYQEVFQEQHLPAYLLRSILWVPREDFQHLLRLSDLRIL